LQHPDELERRFRVLALQDQRLAAAPGCGAIGRSLLADMVGAGFSASAFGLPRAVERGRHAPVDRRLHRARVGAAFLDPELDPKQIAQECALGALAQMQYGRPLVRLLRKYRDRMAQTQAEQE